MNQNKTDKISDTDIEIGTGTGIHFNYKFIKW